MLFDAHRKRQQRFERALSMARTQLVHKARKPRMPPMAYVEEIFPEEPIQAPPEHLLFTVPDNWNPPTCFPGEAELKATGTPHSFHRKDDQTEEPTTCYVEEEITEAVDATGDFKRREFSMDADHQNAQRGPQGRHETGEEEAIKPGEALSEDSWVREGGMAPMPRPLSIMQEAWRVQPPFFHLEHLELIFETRSLVEDQIHRAIQINQRIDMLYDAYSNTPPGRRCPTCAQPFALPARAGKQGGDAETTG
jgi:hypothetical protein